MEISTRACATVTVLLALTGCSNIFGTQDGSQQGTPLGTFHVAATRTSNTCGEGALGATASWEFDVKLARATGKLYWNNGAAPIAGTLDADQVSFHFDNASVTDMRAGSTTGGLKPCSVSRHDASEGVLAATGNDITSFSGSLSYDYMPTDGSECGDLVTGSAAVFAGLPCGLAYKLSATRTSAAPK